MAWEREHIGNCTLYRGDAREVLPTLGSVDAVITDPPYGVGLQGKRATMGPRRTGTTFRPGHYSHPDTPAYIAEVVIPTIAYCRALAGCVVVTPGVRNMWLYPPPDDVGVFYSGAGTGMGRWGFTCAQPILYYGRDPYSRAGLGSRPNSCGQTYPNDANKQSHPCAKPLPMMRWLVNRASLEGETVCDAFMGVATIGLACLQLGRQYIGIELERCFFEGACRRIEEASRQLDFLRPLCMPVASPQERLFA